MLAKAVALWFWPLLAAIIYLISGPDPSLSFLLSRTLITFKIGVFGHSYIANWSPLTSASNVEGGPPLES